MAKKREPQAVTIVSAAKQKSAVSKQKDGWKNITGIVHPETPFELLVDAYQGSFIVGGIVDRVATSAASGFTASGDGDLDRILSGIDTKYVFENLYVCGNVFLEVVRSNDGKISQLFPFITQQVRVKVEAIEDANVLSYVQLVNGIDKQPFKSEEVIHARLSSMSSRYYGDSKIAKASAQISLLAQIDQYYASLFDRGFLGTSFLIDKEGKLTEEQKKALKTALSDRAAGIKNAFSTAIIPTAMERIDLDTPVDTSAFLEYRKELIKSVCVALVIPYDLLISDSSNRAAAVSSLEAFNKDVVTPLQESFMRQLRFALEKDFPKIKDVTFNPVDVSNQLEEMKVDVGYKHAGIMSANEVRGKLGLGPIAGADALETSKDVTNGSSDTANITKAEDEIRKLYEEITK